MSARFPILGEAGKAKLICGIISSKGFLLRAEEVLVDEFGEIDSRSATIPFNFTRYYEKEMGGDLWRRWVAFKEPLPEEAIKTIKLKVIQLETNLARPDGSRTVNLDPGYVTPSKLVLATRKDYSHRVYLGEGVFAEVTLIRKGGRFNPLDWTYPDYRTDHALRFFEQLRIGLKGQPSK